MAASPILYVYYAPSNDDAYPGVPARHITEADWAAFTIAQRRTVENATTQDGYTRRKVWVHIDLVDETEAERAAREAAEAAARAEYDRKNSLVRYGQIEAMIDQLEVLPPAEEFAALRQDVDAVADVPPRVDAVEGAVSTLSSTVSTVQQRTDVLAALRFDPAHPMYGAVRGSVSAAQRTANTAAINLAAEDARIAGGTLVLKGDYEIDGMVSLRCHVDGADSRLTVRDTILDPVLRFGGTTPRSAVSRYAMLPSVVQASHVYGGGWNADAGIEIRSVDNCQITVPYVVGFGAGLRVASSAGGCSYNDITVGHLHSNRINLDIVATSPGWVNENRFRGPFRLSFESTEGTNVPGTRQIRMLGYAGSGANNCTFYSPSIERDTPEYHVELTEAVFNTFVQARWEAVTPKVLLNNASNNVIFYGYNAHGIVFTQTGVANSNNHVYDRNRMRVVGGTPGGVFVGENQSSSGNAVFVAMPSGAGLNADPATAYGAAIGAQSARFKATADAHPRIEINNTLGRILFGPGNAAPTNFLRFWDTGIQASGPLAVNGATPAAKPTITGSRSDGTALSSLLTALASMGFITDSTTA